MFASPRAVRLHPGLGIQEAIKAGKALHQNGFEFDLCYTSVLTRAIQTFNYAAEELDCHYIPVIKNWRLNERHYGALQGLNKLETVEKHGKEQVQIWRRSYDIPPPELEDNDARHPKNDKRYRELLNEGVLPKTEVPVPPLRASRLPSTASCPTGTKPSCPPSSQARKCWWLRTATV